MLAKALLRSLVPPPAVALARAGRLYLRRPEVYFQDGPSFRCPICGYEGRFLKTKGRGGLRLHAICPRCGSFERHRLQRCVLDELFANVSPAGAALHFAPEPALVRYLQPKFSTYTTADIKPNAAEVTADLRDLPFENASYDFVFASHVLEHVDHDAKALSEIARLLRPEGIAILPVPVFGKTTREYPFAVPSEEFHVRAPGLDYFDRYRRVFRQVTVKSSADYLPECQTELYEDRSVYPTRACPFREPALGDRHPEYVPICYR